MITINLDNDIKNLKFKPTSFKEFSEVVKNLYNLDNKADYSFQYCDDDKYYSLDIYNYHYFFVNDKINKVFIYSNSNKMEENKYDDEEPDFYDEENSNNKKEDVNKVNPDIVKQYIINSQKEKIIQSRKKEREEREKNQKFCENKNINNDNMISNNKMNNDLNKIINKTFDKLKEELINESNVTMSKIVMESKLMNIDKNKEEENNINIPISVESHTGIACSSCGMCPIRGVRYKCVYCDSFDYCEKCEKEKGVVHKHPLYKLRYNIK